MEFPGRIESLKHFFLVVNLILPNSVLGEHLSSILLYCAVTFGKRFLPAIFFLTSDVGIKILWSYIILSFTYLFLVFILFK